MVSTVIVQDSVHELYAFKETWRSDLECFHLEGMLNVWRGRHVYPDLSLYNATIYWTITGNPINMYQLLLKIFNKSEKQNIMHRLKMCSRSKLILDFHCPRTLCNPFLLLPTDTTESSQREEGGTPLQTWWKRESHQGQEQVQGTARHSCKMKPSWNTGLT